MDEVLTKKIEAFADLGFGTDRSGNARKSFGEFVDLVGQGNGQKAAELIDGFALDNCEAAGGIDFFNSIIFIDLLDVVEKIAILAGSKDRIVEIFIRTEFLFEKWRKLVSGPGWGDILQRGEMQFALAHATNLHLAGNGEQAELWSQKYGNNRNEVLFTLANNLWSYRNCREAARYAAMIDRCCPEEMEFGKQLILMSAAIEMAETGKALHLFEKAKDMALTNERKYELSIMALNYDFITQTRALIDTMNDASPKYKILAKARYIAATGNPNLADKMLDDLWNATADHTDEGFRIRREIVFCRFYHQTAEIRHNIKKALSVLFTDKSHHCKLTDSMSDISSYLFEKVITE